MPVGANKGAIRGRRRRPFCLLRNRMSGPNSPREVNPPRRRPDSLPDGRLGNRARNARLSLWQSGALFHAFARYPRNPGVPRADRLAGILRNGLLAPASCPDGSVRSDLHLVVTGTDMPYDSLVFLHRVGPQSWIYTMA